MGDIDFDIDIDEIIDDPAARAKEARGRAVPLLQEEVPNIDDEVERLTKEYDIIEEYAKIVGRSIYYGLPKSRLEAFAAAVSQVSGQFNKTNVATIIEEEIEKAMAGDRKQFDAVLREDLESVTRVHPTTLRESVYYRWNFGEYTITTCGNQGERTHYSWNNFLKLVGDKSTELTAYPQSELRESEDWHLFVSDIMDERAIEGVHADVLDTGDFITRKDTDELLVYNPDTGQFEDDGEAVAKERLSAGLGEAYSQARRREIVERLKAATRVERSTLNGGDRKLICLGNCVLDLSDPSNPERLEHNPEYRFTRGSDTDYEPDVGFDGVFDQFVRDVADTEADYLTAQEFAGYTLAHWGLRFHRALFLVGDTRSGKGTFLSTIADTLGGTGEGTDDSAAVSLKPRQLMTERFASAELYGAWFNESHEIGDHAIDKFGTFNSILAGDRMKAEQKNKDPFFFEPTVKHGFSANRLPNVRGDDAEVEAFFERVLLVAFPRTVPIDERDRDLKESFDESAVLNWMLEGYRRLREQDGFTKDPRPDEAQEMWNSWGTTTDRFVHDCVQPDPDGAIPSSEVMEAFIEYCRERDLSVDTSKTKLVRELRGLRFIDGDKKRAYFDGEQKRAIVGAKLVDPSEEEEEPADQVVLNLEEQQSARSMFESDALEDAPGGMRRLSGGPD